MGRTCLKFLFNETVRAQTKPMNVYNITPSTFTRDPYPDLAVMQALAPVVYVPQLDATLILRRDDVFVQEKNVALFSSDQPGGLMTVLMGENMMRKDGEAHQAERRAVFPALSPRTVRDHWHHIFHTATTRILEALAPRGHCDLVRDFAMPVSGEALRAITGLTSLTATDMDAVSQAMIDGIANYGGDAQVEARCHAATAQIDTAIQQALTHPPDGSLVSVQKAAGLPEANLKANIKLAISGGQNEPRDAIAGTAWALLTHPDQLAHTRRHGAWRAAFSEYARWISPIGMSPRRVTKNAHLLGHDFPKDGRVFFMFGAANRDPRVFSNPDAFDTTRDTSKSVSFGAGPHFCAGAAVSTVLIADIALPLLFERLKGLRLTAETPFTGWAFRGPQTMPVAWDT